MKTRPLSVALVEMPFGPVAWPSIGTSLLKPQLRRAGHECRILYLNHWFARYIGAADRTSMEVYHDISDAFGPHLGEWIFVRAAFPEMADAAAFDREYLERLRAHDGLAALARPAQQLRYAVQPFLRECIESVDWSAFDVIGFANSFSQLNASLALSSMIRERWPTTPIIMGGCGCSDIMGVAVLRTSPLIRAVALGEADLIICDLVEAVHADSDERLATIPGVAFREFGGEIRYARPKERVLALDALPYPDYDDYYDFRTPELEAFLPFYIPVESSRGCWWGEKSHCTFCGLNPDRMAFHQKEPDRFLDEIGFLARRHHPKRFMCVDNIMPSRYYTEMVPRLGRYTEGAEVFFEIKANFRREQLAVFRTSNIRQVQPGIESLSTPVLKLMGKGITAIANIYTLRLCAELGLRAHWSILFGFAEERIEHYLVTAELVRRIQHLRPPLGLVQVEVERFAPMFRLPEQNGLKNLRPSDWYQFCYPVSADVLSDLAYRFDSEYIRRPPELSLEIIAQVRPLVTTWRDAFTAGIHSLEQRERDGQFSIRRRIHREVIDYSLDDVASCLYADLQSPRYVRPLVPSLNRAEGYEPYLDECFKREAVAASQRGGRSVRISDPDRAGAYIQLLLHGLIVEEGGMAVAVACYPEEVIERQLAQPGPRSATVARVAPATVGV